MKQKMSFVILISAIVALLLLTGTLFGPPRLVVKPEAASHLNELLAQWTRDGTISGSVLIAQDGQVFLNEGYGLADRAQEIPNTPQTRFHLGSISKQFTAIAILILQSQGKLNVQDPICNYMVSCPEAWQDITIHQLDAGLMTVFGLQEISAAINEYGTPEVKAKLLPRFSHEGASGAMILTEPEAGSHLGGVQTRATYDEESGKWYLDGVKRFATNGGADIQLVQARSEPGSSDARGLSLYFVERDETVQVRRIENKLGIHPSPTCEVQYHHTPAELLGTRR